MSELETARRIIREVVDNFFENQAKPITDPSKKVLGPDLVGQIVNALEVEGLLNEPS